MAAAHLPGDIAAVGNARHEGRLGEKTYLRLTEVPLGLASQHRRGAFAAFDRLVDGSMPLEPRCPSAPVGRDRARAGLVPRTSAQKNAAAAAAEGRTPGGRSDRICFDWITASMRAVRGTGGTIPRPALGSGRIESP
jgi:hypothetical protein